MGELGIQIGNSGQIANSGLDSGPASFEERLPASPDSGRRVEPSPEYNAQERGVQNGKTGSGPPRRIISSRVMDRRGALEWRVSF